MKASVEIQSELQLPGYGGESLELPEQTEQQEKHFKEGSQWEGGQWRRTSFL